MYMYMHKYMYACTPRAQILISVLMKTNCCIYVCAVGLCQEGTYSINGDLHVHVRI